MRNRASDAIAAQSLRNLNKNLHQEGLTIFLTTHYLEEADLLCVLVKEVFEAQTLLNLPRFLMIFLSGVVYPVSAMPDKLRYLAHAMPLTYTVGGLQWSFSRICSRVFYRHLSSRRIFGPFYFSSNEATLQKI